MNYHPKSTLFERLVRGWIFVSARGKNLCEFADTLRKQGIICRRQRVKEDCLCFIIRRCDRKETELIADDLNITLSLKSMFSIPEVFSRYKSRIGIPIGIILGAALLVYSSNVIMVIELQGNEAITDNEMMAVLEECGVKRGSFIGDIDFYKSELYVQSAFDEVAWIGMRHTGNRIVVEVMETQPPPESLDDRIPCHIIAAKTAQITNAGVTRGQLVHSEGTAVKEGEVIVSGIWADEYGHVTFSHSMAEIRGIYEEEQTFICSSVQEDRNYTGNELCNKTLDIFTFEIPIAHKENVFKDYNIRRETRPMTLFGKLLPISINRKVYMEYTTEEEVLTEEQQRHNLIEQQARYEDNFLADSHIISAKRQFTKKETATILTVSYVIEGEIGTEQELLLKEQRKPYVARSRKDD